MAEVIQQATSGATIPLWSFTVPSPVDGNAYTGAMVGRSPFFHGHRVTTVQIALVPMIMTFTDTGFVADPTVPDPCIGNSTVIGMVENSPIFRTASFTMNGVNVGTAQYVDAFQRANFWTAISPTGDSYHTQLNLTVLPAQQVTLGTSAGATAVGGCHPLGLVDINAWESLVRGTLIPSLTSQGVGPTIVPVFVFDSVVLCLPVPNGCGVGGYHSAFFSGGALQTYATSNFDAVGAFGDPDISILSHELAEWMDDPTTMNSAPAWGGSGQARNCCEANLEVGDPLTGSLFPPVTLNGFTYNPQELAFFSWFYRQSPSIGAGGLYSNNGTFTTGAGAICAGAVCM